MSIVNYYRTECSTNDISKNFAKIVFICGIILATTMLLEFCTTKYMCYLLDSEHGSEKYWNFIETFQGLFKVSFWGARVCFLFFYLGMLPILMARKVHVTITISCLILATYLIYTYFDSETFNLVFSPEKYKISCFVASCIMLAINSTFYLYLYIGSRDKYVNLAGRLLLITCAIDIVNITSYSIMFSIDSSHFTERFSDVIKMFKFYYSYISSPIHICALSLMLYQLHLFLKHKKKSLKLNLYKK